MNVRSSGHLTLKSANSEMRILITGFLFTLTIGYVIGLAFMHHTTGTSPRGISEEYRGSPETEQREELKFEKSQDEMYIFLHNHVLSLSLIFFAVGGIFALTSTFGSRMKAVLILEPFIAILSTFGGIAMVRYVSEHFTWLVLISGVSMVVSYAAMVGTVLKELWIDNRQSERIVGSETE